MTPEEVNTLLWVMLIATSICVRIATKSTATALAVFIGLYFIAKVMS